jgi:uncharacterized membrane protein YebE (DUF533 family)
LNDPSQILSLFLEGALGRSGRKRARKAARFVSGHKGLISASSLLAVAGVAWGIYDSMKSAAGTPASAAPQGWSPQPVAVQGVMSAGSSAPVVPPIPNVSDGPPVPPEVLRLVRLTISAARADGDLSAAERTLILEHARKAGVEADVERELDQPRPLSEIVRGISDEQARRDLYTLAFSIVRADESVSGAERIYLAQLAHQLGLDAPTAASLESDAAARIDAGDEAQGLES